MKVANSGKEGFPQLLARQPLPKDFAAARASSGPEENPDLYYTADDFIVGNTINVLGRAVLLRSCDAFTRSFYKDVLGFEQPAPVPPPVVERAVVEHAIPPPTGYGDDEDSLGSFYRLNPKAPKKDFNKLMDRDGEVGGRPPPALPPAVEAGAHPAPPHANCGATAARGDCDWLWRCMAFAPHSTPAPPPTPNVAPSGVPLLMPVCTANPRGRNAAVCDSVLPRRRLSSHL